MSDEFLSYFFGIDPDTKATAMAFVAVCGESICPIKGILFKAPNLLEMIRGASSDFTRNELTAFHPRAMAVESQHIVRGRTDDPSSIIQLAQVAGAYAAVAGRMTATKLLMPKPEQWKGSVPKQIHQARIARILGWSCDKKGSLEDGYVVPRETPLLTVSVYGGKFNPGDWKHLMDAFGLAIHAAKEDNLALRTSLSAAVMVQETEAIARIKR